MTPVLREPRWLEPLGRALDERPVPITIFFRDDDAGWADERLCQLAAMFEANGTPLDLAAIPAAVTPALARRLTRLGGWLTRLTVHQHGYTHANHEPAGRKCEFGPSRSVSEQEADIAAGRQRLAELFGPGVAPVFTPPWNRCTGETGMALRRLGFEAVSRDRTAGILGVPGLAEVPVRVNWFIGRAGRHLTSAEMGHVLVDAVGQPEPLGIMFHHAVMDDDTMRATGELLELISRRDHVRCVPMMELVRDAERRGDASAIGCTGERRADWR